MQKISEENILDYTISDFQKNIASDSPTPGGGSVSAITAAYGMSLIGMAIATLRKQNNEILQAHFNSSNAIALTLLDLSKKDIVAFNKYMDAIKLSKDTEEDRLIRKEAMNEAVINATLSPIETASAIVEGMLLASLLFYHIKKDILSDLAAGTSILFGSLKAVLLNVDINLPYIKNDDLRQMFIDKQFALNDLGTKIHDELYLRCTQVLRS